MKIDKKKEKIKELLKNIHSKDEKKVLAAIHSLKVNGDDSVIQEIIQLWIGGVSKTVEKEIIHFIEDIKSSSSAKIIMNILLDNSCSSVRTYLLSTIWNSSVDYSEFITDFVRLSVENELSTTIECLTIIENLHGPFNEKQILESSILLREYAEKEQKVTPENSQKMMLLKEINQIISAYERNIDGL